MHLDVLDLDQKRPFYYDVTEKKPSNLHPEDHES